MQEVRTRRTCLKFTKERPRWSLFALNPHALHGGLGSASLRLGHRQTSLSEFSPLVDIAVLQQPYTARRDNIDGTGHDHARTSQQFVWRGSSKDEGSEGSSSCINAALQNTAWRDHVIPRNSSSLDGLEKSPEDVLAPVLRSVYE